MKMKIVSVVILFTMAVSTSFTTQAQETDQHATIWTCNFKDGKGMEDLQAWRDFFVSQLERIGSDDMSSMSAFAWTPRLAGAEADLLWIEYHDNLNTYGRAVEEYDASEHSVPAEVMWEAVLDCSNSHHFRRQIFNGGDVSITAPAIVETFRCRFHPGKSMSDVEQALPRWAGINANLETSNGFQAYMFTPLHSSSGFDVAYYGVYDTITDYARGTSAYLYSEAGQAMTAAWNEIHRCESSIFNGRRMIPAGP